MRVSPIIWDEALRALRTIINDSLSILQQTCIPLHQNKILIDPLMASAPWSNYPTPGTWLAEDTGVIYGEPGEVASGGDSTECTLDDPVSMATAMWKDVFHSGPYTSFNMVEAIATLLSMSDEDILRDPAQLKLFDPHVVTEYAMEEEPLRSTWLVGAGRCTSFAIKIASTLEGTTLGGGDSSARPGALPFNFRYFQIGNHRVARCQNHCVLIDSSSDVGAVKLLQDSEVCTSIYGLVGHWKFAQGELKYQRQPGRRTKTSSAMGRAQAMRACLKEVADKAILVCLFR